MYINIGRGTNLVDLEVLPKLSAFDYMLFVEDMF